MKARVRAILGADTPWGLCVGWILWSSALVSMYVVLSLGCRISWADRDFGPVNVLTLLLALVWLAHLAVLVALVLRSWRKVPAGDGALPENRRFLSWATRAAHVSATLGTLWLGFPVLALSPCT